MQPAALLILARKARRTRNERSIVDQGNNQFHLSLADEGVVPAQTPSDPWQLRAQRAESEVRLLTEQVKEGERQIAELRNTFIATASLYQAVKEKLERELESLRAIVATATSCPDGPVRPSRLSRGVSGVIVHLPYMTRILAVMIDAMNTSWSQYDEQHPPKSATIAREIDRKLNYRPQPGGEPSRSGQTYAAAIRPDWIKEAESRHQAVRVPDGAS